MAYVGETPWHKLGNQLPAKQPIEVWAEKAGMDWEIRETPALMATSNSPTFGQSNSPRQDG